MAAPAFLTWIKQNDPWGKRLKAPKRVLLLVCVCGVFLCMGMGTQSLAYDQQISSTLYASGYSIRAANGTLLDRRKIVEDLHLAAWNLTPGSNDPYYDGPRLSIEFNLRLDGDFGVTNREMSSGHLNDYVPGISALSVEAAVLFLDIQGLFSHHVDIRLGRQIQMDTIGFVALDGAQMAVYLPGGWRIVGFGGWEVMGAMPLGYDSLELDGVDNQGREELDAAYFSSLVEPESTVALGAELSFAPNAFFDGALGFRQMGLGKKVQQQAVAARASVGNERIFTTMRVVLNPLLDRYDGLKGALRDGTLVTQSDAEISVQLVERNWVRLGYELYRPVFMLDSIFNIFSKVAHRDVTSRYEYRTIGGLAMGAWSFVRYADQTTARTQTPHTSGVIGGGGGCGVNYHTFHRRFATRLLLETEQGAVRSGVEADVGRRYANERLWLQVRASYWHIDDLLYGNRKNIVGYVFSTRYQFTQNALAMFEFENYFGGGDPRFVATAMLQWDIWR